MTTRPNPNDLAALIASGLQRAKADATPSRMIVDAIDADGLVMVRGVRSGATPEGPYERLGNVGALSPGDYVWVQPSVGTTGRPTYVVAGKIGAGPAGPGIVVVPKSASVADTQSTTNASPTNDALDVTALTADVALGAGTWTIAAVGGLAIRHSVGSARWRLQIDGVNATDRSLFVTTELTGVDDATVTGVEGGRTISVKLRYRGSDAGTTYARNPWVMVVATRE